MIYESSKVVQTVTYKNINDKGERVFEESTSWKRYRV